jgi:hypothetical protein
VDQNRHPQLPIALLFFVPSVAEKRPTTKAATTTRGQPHSNKDYSVDPLLRQANKQASKQTNKQTNMVAKGALGKYKVSGERKEG